MSRESVDEELVEVENLLRSLGSPASHMDFAETMYLAGRASAAADRVPRVRGARAWFWPCATAVSTAVSLTFACLWAVGGRPQLAERVVSERVSAPQDMPTQAMQAPGTAPQASQNENRTRHDSPDASETTKNWQEYAQLRHAVLSRGVEGLPNVHWRPASARRSAGWDGLDGPALRRLLGS
jgi:hypothetical protein